MELLRRRDMIKNKISKGIYKHRACLFFNIIVVKKALPQYGNKCKMVNGEKYRNTDTLIWNYKRIDFTFFLPESDDGNM